MGKILLSDRENIKDGNVNSCGDELGFKCSLKKELCEVSVVCAFVSLPPYAFKCPAVKGA